LSDWNFCAVLAGTGGCAGARVTILVEQAAVLPGAKTAKAQGWQSFS